MKAIRQYVTKPYTNNLDIVDFGAAAQTGTSDVDKSDGGPT